MGYLHGALTTAGVCNLPERGFIHYQRGKSGKGPCGSSADLRGRMC